HSSTASDGLSVNPYGDYLAGSEGAAPIGYYGVSTMTDVPFYTLLIRKTRYIPPLTQSAWWEVRFADGVPRPVEGFFLQQSGTSTLAGALLVYNDDESYFRSNVYDWDSYVPSPLSGGSESARTSWVNVHRWVFSIRLVSALGPDKDGNRD
ncbi:unnamed protein product, partial [Amoebophrya sp. A120]